MNYAFLFEKFQSKQHLRDKPYNQINSIKRHMSIAKRKTINILHSNIELIPTSKTIIVPDYIRMIKASRKYFRLFLHLLHIKTIIITVKLKLYLHFECFTFFKANRVSPICTLRTFPNDPAPTQPNIFIVIILTCGKFNDDFLLR